MLTVSLAYARMAAHSTQQAHGRWATCGGVAWHAQLLNCMCVSDSKCNCGIMTVQRRTHAAGAYPDEARGNLTRALSSQACAVLSHVC